MLHALSSFDKHVVFWLIGYYAVCSVPKHARDIVVKEVSFSNDVYLAVKLETPDQYVLNGKENDGAVWQNVKAAGTVIDYSRPAYGIESIKIAGPVQQRINAMVRLWFLLTL